MNASWVRLLLCCSCAALIASVATPSFAQDNGLVPPKAQSDSQVSVWVNNASLDLFVEQLALLTGRDVSIEGSLEGQVSGSFNGSMSETLSAVSEQFPVLFDLDERTLGAVPVAMRASSTVPLGDTVLDVPQQEAMLAGLLPGNAVQFDDEHVTVSGHPAFVERTVLEVSSAVAMGEPVDPPIAQDIGNDQPSTSVQQSAVPAAGDESPTAADSTDSSGRTYGWVTDIPGFDTF